jgi:hypothetical protein
MLATGRTCMNCAAEIPVQSGRGRPRKYCAIDELEAKRRQLSDRLPGEGTQTPTAEDTPHFLARASQAQIEPGSSYTRARP